MSESVQETTAAEGQITPPETPQAAQERQPALDVEVACEVMHDAYEAAAAQEGWETQERSRKAWADVPEANKATMRTAVRALLGHIAVVQAAQERPAGQGAPTGEGGAGSEAQGGALREFVQWLADLDDPDPSSQGFQDRRTVTLTQITDMAFAALDGPEVSRG